MYGSKTSMYEGHCMTWINDTHVIMTGGKYNGGQTYIIDISR